jgi:hypothetical protein
LLCHYRPLKNWMYHLCLDSEVTDVAGHLLDARKSWAGDLVAAEGGVNADENTGLSHEVSTEVKGLSDGGNTHIVALVERGGRDTRWDGRAGAGDLEIDALRLSGVTLSGTWTSSLPEGSSEHHWGCQRSGDQ